MKKFIFQILTLISLVNAKNIDEIFHNANLLMGREKYTEAVKTYKLIMNFQPLRSEIFYNLGNAYFRLDSLGLALWAYSTANLISPRNEDIKYNLNLVNDKLVGDIRLPNRIFFQKIYRTIKGSFTFIEWSFFSSLLTLSYFFLNFISSVLKQKNNLNLVNKGLLSFVLVFNILTFDKFIASKKKKAIIVKKSSEAFSEPFSQNGTLLFVLNEGEKLELIEKQGSWTLIKNNYNNEKGWIQNASYLEL